MHAVVFPNGTKVRIFHDTKSISSTMTKKKSSIKQSMKWKWQFSSKNIEIVEKTCEKVIETLGYTKFNKDFVHSRKQILSKKWKDIWPHLPPITSFFDIIKNTSTISNSLLFPNISTIQ